MTPTPTRAPATNGPSEFVIDGGTFVVPPEAHRLDGFREWATRPDFPEKTRVYFNKGAVCIDMSNEELETHCKVKLAISTALDVLNAELDLGDLYPDGVLLTNAAAEVSNNPDGLFVLWESFDEGRVEKVARRDAPGEFVELEGTPDWVLEVVSKSSVKKDTQELREAYHRAGVPEYWLVDARKEPLSFRILTHRKSRYFASKQKGGRQWSAVFGRWFRLTRVKGRHESWRYALESRPE